MNLRQITRNYAAISLCLVVVFLIAPMTSDPSAAFDPNNNGNLDLFNNMGLSEHRQDFVDSSTSDIDSSPDIGTHSNFANQQAGPDSTYDNLTEANTNPPPTDSENDIDSDSSNVDSNADIGIEGTFSNAQGSALDSSYFAIQEESVTSPYGGEIGSVFVTGSVPNTAGNDDYAFYQAIFWNPTDGIYQISLVNFSYYGSAWLNGYQSGSGSSYPISGWNWDSNGFSVFWTSGTPITVQPHTASSFYVRGDSNKVKGSYIIDIQVTANSSMYSESYTSGQQAKNIPAAQLWLGSSLPPTQIHSVSPSTQTTISVSLEEDDGGASILSGGTLTIDVPSGFTGITSVGGANWDTASINGNQITVSNNIDVTGTFITYSFQITAPSTPGLYKLNLAFSDGGDANPIANFTIHVTGVPESVETLDLEYQWSTASYSDTYEKVCINVGSHTGTESLVVNYWDGFLWNELGTITSTGWNNFTATGLTSSTYTIQLIGGSEISDSSKDSWNIDLITLHTWSVQTYNYKLDLEIQWTSANYTQDYEELCIYTGGLDAESIRVDVWNGADWTNIALDLTASSWNNFTVDTWLTSSTFTIRFRGDIEVSDTTQSSWEIDVCLLHTWDNNVPQTTPTPSISNLDDATFLYANYRQYQLTVEVSDADGYADIDYFDLTLTSDDRGTEYWTIRYDEDTNNFTEQSDPSNYITLDTISSNAIESGNTIDATFFITINWNHPDTNLTDLKSEVYDSNPSSSSIYFEVDWDVETRLDMNSGPMLDDSSGTPDRGDLDSSMTASGTITYLGSNLHPPASEIDVWISSTEYGTNVGPWEATDYEDTGGSFSATVYADNVVGLDNYTFKAVEQGAGASGGNLFNSSEIAQYIADRVQVQSYSTDDSRIDVNTDATLHVVLFYDYDDSFVVDGTVTINGRVAIYSGANGIWNFTDQKSTAQLVTYNSLVYSGGTHGITEEDQNGQSIGQIWDNVRVLSYSVIDSRVNIGSSATIDVTLVYAYDGSFVIDGNVTVNSISATHLGSGVWRFTDSKSAVQSFTFDSVAVSGNAHGIIVVDQNSQSQDVIWDRIIVVGYSVLDNRVNVGVSVNINVTLEYEYDNAPVTDGSVTINLISASHKVDGIWGISVLKGTVQAVTYNSVACSGNLFGITEVNPNSQSQQVIWDRVIVISYSISDSRVSLNDFVDVNVTLHFQYDNAQVTNGTVTINSISAAYLENGIWQISDTNSTVQMYTYSIVACSGNNYGITNVNQNSQSISVIWDQITVRGYEISDARDNVGDPITITVELEYEYDDSDVIDGSVTINSLTFTYTGSFGKWSASRTWGIVRNETFDTVIVSNNEHGITNVNPNGKSQTAIWDRIQVVTTTVGDDRVSTGTSCKIQVTLVLEYDSTPLGLGDTVILNGVAMTWNASSSSFELNRMQSTVGFWTYYINSSLESTYSISALNLNSQDVSVIWDEIIINTTAVDIDRVNVDANVELRVTAQLAYDGHLLNSGDTIVMDGVSMSWDAGNSWFELIRTRSVVGLYNFQVGSALETTYGISSVNLNGQSQNVIWDRLNIVIAADMDSVGNGVQVNFTMTVTYEYDSVICTTFNILVFRNNTYWNTFTNLNLSDFIDTNSAVVYQYNATSVASESTYGITVFSTNIETVAWGAGIAAPVNSVAPVLTNPDDTSYMYAKLRFYLITSSVSDAQNWTDIDYVELSLWDNSRSIEIWRIRYTNSTNTFTILVGSEYIQLGSSFTVRSGLTIDITWSIKIDWDHQDLTNVDIRQYVVDSSLEFDENWYEVTWDVETRLSYSVLPALSDFRGDLNTNDLECNGTVVYYGSSIHPLANETEVWILHDQSGTWSGDLDVSGVFTITGIASSSDVRLNIYTIKVVAQGNGSTGSDLYYTLSATDSFITDRIEFYQSGTDSARINIDDSGVVWWNARYDYDNVSIVSGLSAQMNGTKILSWDSLLSRWNYSEVFSNVGRTGYSILSASESGFGLTGWIQTASNVSIIWDKIVVRSYESSSLRTNVSDIVDIDVLLEYEYDDSWVTDGYVEINDISAVYQTDGKWRISQSRSSVTSVTYNTVTCSLNEHDITTVDQNIQSISIIWDRILVESYTVSDARVSIDTFVNISVTLKYEYDNTPVTDGSVTINLISASHTIDGVWRISVSKGTVQAVTYNSIACSGNANGIIIVNQNSKSTLVIWDRVIVISYQVLDSRVNIGDSVDIDVSLEFEFDGTDVTNGSVQINTINASYVSGNIWRIIASESIVASNLYDAVTCSGNNYGISTVNQNSKSTEVIWDRIIVRSYTVSDNRDDVGSIITINITLQYEYNNESVTIGNVIVNSIPFAYTLANGIWSVNRMQSVVTSETYNIVVVSGTNYGITSVNQNGQSTTIIWDRIRILTTSADYNRLDTGIDSRIMVTAELEYDGHLLGSGDSLVLDGSAMTWDGSNGWFYLDVSQSSIGLWTYFVNGTGASEATYEITAVSLNSQSVDVIWDELSIIITPSDTTPYDFTTVNFLVDISSSFDGSPCTSYSIVINRNGTNWIVVTNSNVSLFEDMNEATTYNYTVSSIIFDGTFGLTVFIANTAEVTWITPANFAPSNNGGPVLLNPDDIDNLYARLDFYFIRSSVIDYDGYADINYVELSLWDNNHLFEVWRVRFNATANTFTVELGSEYISLAPSSYYLEMGNLLNVTWKIKIDWDHFDMQNIDCYQYVVDSYAESDGDLYESNWDIETRLDYTILPTLTDHRGDVNTEDLQASGTVIYYGSSLTPLANETDIWVIHDFSGSWSGDVNSFGVISVTNIGSSAAVRLNTYTFKIVPAGAGPASGDLYHTNSPTDTFITDTIEFYISGSVDSRININTACDVWWSARYKYDGTDVQSDLVAYLNGVNKLTWDAANGRWHFQETRTSVTKRIYEVSSAEESLYGISTWTDLTTNQSIIWDSLRIILTDPTDRRIDIGTNATGITVHALYSYDLTRFDGTVLLNNTVFQYSSVQRQYYTVSSAFGDSYNITVIAVNDMTWCIWDQIEVVSLNSDVIYLDPNEYARVQIALQYDFDDAPVTAGTFSLKYQDLMHMGDGIWEVNVTRSFYSSIAFDALTTCNATVFGIGEYNFYGNNLTVYWDRLEFYQSSSPDTRINVGSNGFSIWGVRLQNAHITITSGLVASTSDGSLLTFVDGVWRSTHTSDVVGDITFSIQSASLDGIDFFTSSTNDITIIWDRIEVQTMSATNPNPEIETYIQIRATLVYEYDDTPVTDGSVSLWDQDNQIAMIYNSTGGFWYANITKVDVGNYTFYIQAVSGNLYGISSVNTVGISVTVEFIPAILPRLTPMMIAGISGGFGILLLLSAVLVRRRYRLSVPEEIKQIDRALKAMEAGEPVEGLVVRSAQEILYTELEPGLLALGLTVEELVGEIAPEKSEESWTVDPDAELKDIMDEFKLPGYKQELDEGEIDISILSEEESEKAWSEMLKEVRRIESVEGRKVPLTKEDWIERIPSEIKKIFFEEELLELDIEELEHLTQLTPSELEEIMSSVSSTEDMYASFEPESSAAAISSALSDRLESQATIELDEEEKKERLFALLPGFVKEFFSSTWLEKLSSEEIEELLIIPEDELKAVIESIADSRAPVTPVDVDIQSSDEISDEPVIEETTEVDSEVTEEVSHESEEEGVSEEAEEKEEPLPPTPSDLKDGLVADLKFEKEPETMEDEEGDIDSKIESEDEVDDELLSELDISFEVDDSEDDSEDSDESDE